MTETRWTLDPAIDDFMKTIELPPQSFMDELAAQRAPLEAAAPKPGEAAPAFTAERLSPDGKPAGEYVSLSDYRGRDLALMFGSWTCPIYRGQIDRFNEIFDELRDRLQFLLIYTHEAHPEDGWQVDINHAQDCVCDQPTTTEARAAIAATCVTRHNIELPVALDDMNDSIEKAYAGAPERLYLIDADGTVQHRSGPGPFQMDAVEAWYSALSASARR